MDRHIVHVITNRASYGRVKYLLNEIKNTDGLKLTIITACTALDINVDFDVKYKINCLISGNDHSSMVKTASLLAIECSTLFEQIKPDVVLIHGDRYEQLGVAMAASYLNIPIAHTEGGETSGCIDDKVRNAITALSTIHFPVTENAFIKLHLLGMSNVWKVGSPAIDLCKQAVENTPYKSIEPYILVLFHPNTTEKEQIEPMIEALNRVNIKKIWVNCNIDSGSNSILKRLYNEKWEFKKDLSPEEYYILLGDCSCAVGNSSSFIKEGAFLGIPVVLVGNRQNNREIQPNVMLASDVDTMDILNSIIFQLTARYEFSNAYGDGNASRKITQVLREVTL